jgi:hypothetical protein
MSGGAWDGRPAQARPHIAASVPVASQARARVILADGRLRIAGP